MTAPHECPMCGQDERTHRQHDALLNALRPFAEHFQLFEQSGWPPAFHGMEDMFRTAYRVFKEYAE